MVTNIKFSYETIVKIRNFSVSVSAGVRKQIESFRSSFLALTLTLALF
jgi:hypothetical protein